MPTKPTSPVVKFQVYSCLWWHCGFWRGGLSPFVSGVVELGLSLFLELAGLFSSELYNRHDTLWSVVTFEHPVGIIVGCFHAVAT